MSDPTIKILGVYRLAFDDALVKEQADILYGPKLKGPAREEAERRSREQLASTVLIEALVQDRDDRFRIEHFTQPKAGLPRDNWQAPWAEAYLSLDGETRLETLWPDPPTEKSFRVAFFMYFWDAETPLYSSYGAIDCPDALEMPERLRSLVPYEPLD